MATINHKTYNEATETFKDFNVYDGKETLIFKVDGSEGNVGIGNSSPTATLDITGTLAVSGNSTFDTTTLVVDAAGDRVILGAAASLQGDTIEIHAKSNAGAISLFGRASDNGSAVSFRSNGATTQKAQIYGSDTGLGFATGTTQRVLIDTSGNVGIGTSSPNAPLEIQSNAAANAIRMRARTSDDYSFIQFANNAGNVVIGEIFSQRTGTSIGRLGFSTTNGAGSIERMTISPAGNVGIGTSGPTHLVQIYGASLPELRLGDASAQIQMYTNTTDGVFGTVGGSPLVLRTNATERMRITSTGNVGIGTTTSSYDTNKIGSSHRFLNVQAGAGSYAVGTLAGNQSLNGDRLGYLTFVNDNNSASYKYSAWLGAEVDGTTTNQQGGRLIFSTMGDGSSAGPIERMRITQAGNVGIGNSSPTATLDVTGTLTASGIASLGIGETTELAFIGDRTTVNTRYIKFVRASALTDIVNIQGVNGGVGNTDIALQADGGNVGIGTSAPTRKLQVKGAVGFEATNSTNFWELYNYTDNTLRFNYNGSGSDEITITSAGNVGIGTSAPDTKLQVAATGATGLSIRANTSGDAFMRYYLDTVIASDAYVDRSTGNLNIRTNQNSSAIVFSTSAALIERVRITDNGLTFNGDTAAANALDDYEEGTWTPVLRGSSTAGIYEISDPYAVYTKIGRQVTAGLQFTLSSSITGGGSGYAVIEGLPFNKRANAQFQGICSFEGVAYSGDIVTMEFVSPSSATSLIYFRQSTSGASGSDLNISAFSANDQVKMTITYFV
jgi:hypothetical protein